MGSRSYLPLKYLYHEVGDRCALLYSASAQRVYVYVSSKSNRSGWIVDLEQRSLHLVHNKNT